MSSTVYSVPPTKKSKKSNIRRFLVPLTAGGSLSFGFGSDKKSKALPSDGGTSASPAKARNDRPISYMMVDTDDVKFAPMSWIEVDPQTVTIPEVFEEQDVPIVPSSSFIVPSPTFGAIRPDASDFYRRSHQSTIHQGMVQRGRHAAFPPRPIQPGGVGIVHHPIVKPVGPRDVERYRSCVSKYFPAGPTENDTEVSDHFYDADDRSIYSEEDQTQTRYTIVSTAVTGEGWKTIMDETMSQLTRAEFLLAVGKMIEDDKRKAGMF